MKVSDQEWAKKILFNIKNKHNICSLYFWNKEKSLKALDNLLLLNNWKAEKIFYRFIGFEKALKILYIYIFAS